MKYSSTNNISDFFIGLPNDIDTAFFMEVPAVYLYFTKGLNLYKLKLDVKNDSHLTTTSYGYVEKDYPKPISSLFPRINVRLDTAYRAYCAKEVYFFTGSSYYVLKEDKPIVDGPLNIRGDLIPGFCM